MTRKNVIFLIFIVALFALGQSVVAQDDNDAAKQKEAATTYVNRLVSLRNDPGLERDIRKWWKGPDPKVIADPILRIIFISDAYHFTRSDYGVVQRKTVDAVISWKTKDGSKCYFQWRSFGYESTGDGTFDTEMRMYTKYAYVNLPGDRTVGAGAFQEIDCAKLK